MAETGSFSTEAAIDGRGWTAALVTADMIRCACTVEVCAPGCERALWRTARHRHHCRCRNVMVRTQISLAVVVLLVCSWLPPHAQGSVAARLARQVTRQKAVHGSRHTESHGRGSARTWQTRTAPAQVADSLRSVEQQTQPAAIESRAAARSSPRAAPRMTRVARGALTTTSPAMRRRSCS